MGNYMTSSELDEISSLLKTIASFPASYISIGPLRVSDSNGENLGLVTYEDGQFVFKGESG